MSQQSPMPPSEQPMIPPEQPIMPNYQVPMPQKKSRVPMILGIGCGGLLFLFALCSIFSLAIKDTSSATVQNNTDTSTTPLIQATDTPQPEPTTENFPTPTAVTFPHFDDGTFVVGKDIQPGTYRTRDASSGCYYARLKGFGETMDDMIANDLTDAPAIVTISATDKGFQSKNCGTWTKE